MTQVERALRFSITSRDARKLAIRSGPMSLVRSLRAVYSSTSYKQKKQGGAKLVQT